MAENAQTETTVDTAIDYEAEYRKAVAERDSYKAEAEKQKRMKDQYATENADYKKKAEAQLSDEEKKAKELQDAIDGKNKAEAELAQMRLERSGFDNGFSAAEVAKLIESKFDFKVIAEIVKARTDEAVKSSKAASTKGGTPEDLMGKGSTENGAQNSESDFQKHQKSKTQSSTIVNL